MRRREDVEEKRGVKPLEQIVHRSESGFYSLAQRIEAMRARGTVGIHCECVDSVTVKQPVYSTRLTASLISKMTEDVSSSPPVVFKPRGIPQLFWNPSGKAGVDVIVEDDWNPGLPSCKPLESVDQVLIRKPAIHALVEDTEVRERMA